MRRRIYGLLQEYWGYSLFRPLQEEIILSVLSGNDTMGLLPTGGGKSITFQVPALVLDGMTMVVTPLISLMKDQVDNLRERGVNALYFHSGMTMRESRLAMEKCENGKVKLLYVSPEKLQSRGFIDSLRCMDISLIVVDEAHCISQWGYDFRPSYLRIVDVRRLFPAAPVLALTASATPDVVDDIMTRLEFKGRNLFARSFSRDNLSYVVRYGDHKEAMLMRVLENTSGTGIVYVRSRKRTREIAQLLTASGISTDYYHAGLAPEDKELKQNDWKEGRTRVIVATNAFGMGIDKPDVRVVVHYDLPPSLEEYYQEAGRAGRDGGEAFAVLLVSRYDKGLLTRRIEESFPPLDYIRHVYEMVGNYLDVAVGEGYNNVYEFNFNFFCTQFKLKALTVKSALTLLTRAGYFEFVEEQTSRSRMMILVGKNELYDLRVDSVTDEVFQMILRTYTGLFTDYVYINEPLLASRLNITETRVYESLLYLTRMHVIHYVPRKTTPYIYYTTSRELPKHVQMPLTVYRDQRRRMEQRIKAMQRFAFSTDECRVNTMLRYFGEKPSSPCGKCDVCRAGRVRNDNPDIEDEIAKTVMYLAGQPGGHTVDHIVRQTGHPSARVIAVIRHLADEGAVTLDGLNVSLPQ